MTGMASLRDIVAARYAGHVTLADPEGNEFCVMLT
jgi:hypothetical protein